MEDLMLAVGRWWLHLIGWKPKTLRVYEQLQLSYSDEAVAGMEALGKAMRAYKITLDELSGPYYAGGSSTPHWYRKTGKTFRGADILEPVPEYEGMQFAQADWKLEE